jgi:hypothetical protein
VLLSFAGSVTAEPNLVAFAELNAEGSELFIRRAQPRKRHVNEVRRTQSTRTSWVSHVST